MDGIYTTMQAAIKKSSEGWADKFIVSAGIILLLTAFLKITSAYGHAKVLNINDPIFGVSFRHLMLLAGAMELAVSGMCLLTAKNRLSLLLVAWLAVCFILYRAGLSYMRWQGPCPCMGNLTETLHLSQKMAGSVMTTIAIYLLAGSTLFLLNDFNHKRNAAN